MNNKKSLQLETHKSRQNVADDIQCVISMCGTHPYVKQVITNAGTTPTTILYADDGMSDMKNVFLNHPDTILGVDRTFNLGNIFLTSTVFKHPALIRNVTGEHPILQGPLFYIEVLIRRLIACFFPLEP